MPSNDKRERDYDDEFLAALTVDRRGEFEHLPARIALTYRHLGLGVVLVRSVTFPLRFTPLRHRVPRSQRADLQRVREWYRAHGEPVTIAIPSYRDSDELTDLIRTIRRTTQPDMVDIIVADNASGGTHLERIRRIPGVRVIAGEENRGPAANVNRALRAADPARDVVILNSDMKARPDWLAALQYASRQAQDIAVVGGKLVYPDGRIQSGGTIRNPNAPEWFEHRFRGKPSDWGPANVPGYPLALCSACMYVPRAALDRVGLLDEDYPMGYEDVDWCLRAWEAGMSVFYYPLATLEHYESTSRGSEVGENERTSQRRFWSRWGRYLDERRVRTTNGALRVVYVTEDTGVGGGYRDIFEQLNGLHDRGHDVSLYTIAKRPNWFDLRVSIRTFDDYDALVAALAPIEAIKVATWWNTVSPVWRASAARGIPVYYVQEIETAYFPNNVAMQNAVLNSYRPEFRYLTISTWIRERLRELGHEATMIPPGIDLQIFRPRPGVSRRDDVLLTLGRSEPLKNLPLTIDAWHRLAEPRPSLWMFGIEPALAGEPGMRYVTAPSDSEVVDLLATAGVFVLTSLHEGFALPPLEAMATGAAVVCTDADGNRDYCRHGENCLLVEKDADAVARGIAQLLADPALRGRLGAAGIETARRYAWPGLIDRLETFLEDVARPRHTAATSDVTPKLRRQPR